uniref:Uncharacterized protein n=1 Tax=Anguilla anguilla TaxID=7936 RepID=A0A0E9VAN9_ANGAN
MKQTKQPNFCIFAKITAFVALFSLN